MPAPEPAAPCRLGLLGGTFDPPHLGHLAAATAARDALDLDQVLFVVANDPWQKSPTRAVTPAETRLALARSAVDGLDKVAVSALEIERGGPSYSVDTVEQLAAEARAAGAPLAALYLIVGADLVADLATWERADDLAAQCTLAVVARPGTPPPAAGPGWTAVAVGGPAVDASSSQVRQRLAQGLDVSDLVPLGVVRCIARLGLYAVPR